MNAARKKKTKPRAPKPREEAISPLGRTAAGPRGRAASTAPAGTAGTSPELPLRFERLLADISAHFINLPADEIDSGIENALGRVCDLLDLDRSTLWQAVEGEPGSLHLTHWRLPPGSPPLPRPMLGHLFFPWTAQKGLSGETVIFSRMTDFPPEARRDVENYRAWNTKSTAVFPLSVGKGPVFGLLTFAVMREERDWSETAVTGFKIIAQVFANALHRKFSEASLLESEERFRVTFEQAAVGIAHVSPAGKFLRVNQKFCDIVGYPREEMRERTFQDITYPDDLAADLGQVARLLAGTIDTYTMEKRYVRKDGRLVWVNLTVSLVRDGAGRPRWFVSIIEDINERKRVQQELEDRLKFEKLLIGISTRLSSIPIDRLDGEILEAQRQICEGLALDVCVLWQFSSPGNLKMSHLYGPPDFPALSPEDQDAQTGFPWCLAKVMNKETIVLSRIADAPAAAARDLAGWTYHGLRSVLTFPLFVGDGPPFGAINFNTMKAEREWSAELVGELGIVAQMIANALNRKYNEENLRESEARLKLAADSASAGIWSWDYRSGKIWLTDQARRLYGFSPDEEVTAGRYERALHPDDLDRVRLIAEQGFRQGGVIRTEYRVVLPDGSIRWINARAQAFLDPSGRPASMKGVSLDVTERKEAELALAESEKRYRMLFESAPAGIILIGLDGRVRAANSLQARIYHYDSPRELEGFYAPLFVAEKDRERASRNMREQLGGDDLPGRTYTCVRRDGSEFLAEVTSIILPGPGQDVQGYLCLTRDISKEKQGERERIELRHELAHLARVMAMNELSTSLAHEINQPLGAILNNAEAARSLLGRTKDPGEIGEIVDDIIQDVQRAGDVVRKIRGIVKKSEAKFEPLSVNMLIEEVLQLVSNSLTMNNVTLRLDLAPDLADIRGDRVRLQQVLLNLMTNAIDAMKEASPRVLAVRSAASAADSIVVSIGDTGPGLDPAGLADVFKPFFTTKKGGLGMGLPICQSIVDEHGGRIWGENGAAGGATFHFALKAVSGGSPRTPAQSGRERRRFSRPARPLRGN